MSCASATCFSAVSASGARVKSTNFAGVLVISETRQRSNLWLGFEPGFLRIPEINISGQAGAQPQPIGGGANMARVLIPATLVQLHRPPGWVWVYCARYIPPCQHHAPMALAPLIIRWGPDTSSDVLRQCARCTVCG